MNDSVGFIGLGTMGGPMAQNLVKAGVSLVVHDANPNATKPFAGLPGVSLARSAADVAARTTTLFTCLPNDEIVRSAYLGADGVAAGGSRGLVTCDCSTVSPEVTVELDRVLAEQGITHMDTPMLGSQPQAVSGEIFFIVGGDQAKLATITPYLAIMGTRHMYVGPSGTGNPVKLVHNGLGAVTAGAGAGGPAGLGPAGGGPHLFYQGVRKGGRQADRTHSERRVKR